MGRYLNVSIIQMPISSDTVINLKYLKETVDKLMTGYVKPELIIGVEYGISKSYADTVPGKITDFLSSIAKEYGIYFIPGTMYERNDALKEGEFYNTCPVFAPTGEMIAAYRKKAPFRPGEPSMPSCDDDYCIIEIPEKNIKIGLLICYDQFFPEIARTLALKGAEMIVCPASDPMEFDYISEVIPRARALENELYYIWTSDTSNNINGATTCGTSTIVGPEGEVIYRAGNIPITFTKTLDFDLVSFKREYGRDQHLNALKHFNVKYPYANNLESAPVYKTLGKFTTSPDEYSNKVKNVGVGTIGNKVDKLNIRNKYLDIRKTEENLINFLKTK
ncbi:carbon-nitrogen hydrolase family protein [Peribacillus simplex]|uniref:carbon-nitrogen hydrolase family protein n=1 Tax=Peribacillus simplex TaxID=1478 RepID=UPI003D297910